MKINRMSFSNIDAGNSSLSKKKKPHEPGDSFTSTGKELHNARLSAADIGRLFVSKKAGDSMADVKNKKELIAKIQHQLETARPELEELQKQGIIDEETAKSILFSGGQDPHVHNCIKTDGELSTKPIIRKDGSFVAGGGNGIMMKYLTAYSPDGKVLWRGDDLLDKQPSMDVDGNFYFARNNGTVSYDKDGNKRWELNLDNRAPGFIEYNDTNFGSSLCNGPSGPPAIDEKRKTMYMGEWYGKFIAVDKDTGKIKWFRKRNGMIGNSDPVLDKKGNVFFHDDNGYVLSLKPDGRENWILGAGDPTQYPVGTKMFDNAGTSLWMKEVGRNRRDSNAKRKEGETFAVGTTQILINNEKIVAFGMRDGRVMGLNHDTGKVEMFFDAEDSIFKTPLDAGDGKLIFSNSKGQIFCVDTKNTVDTKYGKQMRKLWDVQFDEYAAPELVDGDGKIYIQSSEKGLIVLNPDGSTAWRAAVHPRNGITTQKDGSILITEEENLLEIRPLANRVEELRKEGKLLKDDSVERLNESTPTIELSETTVNIGGVVLRKNK